MTKTFSLIASAFLSLFIIMPAQANDAALYAPEPPENAAFVRVINGTATKLDSLALGGIAFTNVDAESISPYQIVPEGQYASPKDAAVSWDIQPKKYYVLTMSDSATTLVEEQGVENPAKSQVYFYNLTSKPDAALHAPKHSVDIVGGVEAGNQTSKSINALTLDISARVGGEEVELFPGVELQRRIGTTFVVSEDAGGKLTAFYSDNQQAQ